MRNKYHKNFNSTLPALLAFCFLSGCDYHQDSVYLGRKEAELLVMLTMEILGLLKIFLIRVAM